MGKSSRPLDVLLLLTERAGELLSTGVRREDQKPLGCRPLTLRHDNSETKALMPSITRAVDGSVTTTDALTPFFVVSVVDERLPSNALAERRRGWRPLALSARRRLRLTPDQSVNDIIRKTRRRDRG